jgi:hypothetical protein
MTEPSPPEADWTETLKAAAAQIGAARMAAAIAAIQPGPVHPDIIRGIERLTGERYDPAVDRWYLPGEPAVTLSPAATLKAALAAMPLTRPPSEVFTAVRAASGAQHAAGGGIWVMRCSADIAQAHRFPGMRVEVIGAWLSGRWELLDEHGQVIAASGGDS